MCTYPSAELPHDITKSHQTAKRIKRSMHLEKMHPAVYGIGPKRNTEEIRTMARAELIASPSGFSVLEFDNVAGLGSTASLTDGKGRATFSGVYINEIGEGFVCRFVAFNSAGVGVAWTDSEPFDVEVGEPYTIALSTPVGRMDGGSTFDIPPVIAVQVCMRTSILDSPSSLLENSP